MSRAVSGVMSMLGGASRGQRAAEAQARQQQQVAQLNQAEAAREGSRSSAEALGTAARRKRGMLLLDTRGGKETLG